MAVCGPQRPDQRGLDAGEPRLVDRERERRHDRPGGARQPARHERLAGRHRPGVGRGRGRRDPVRLRDPSRRQSGGSVRDACPASSGATTYTDAQVDGGASYAYVVRSIDTSFNRSGHLQRGPRDRRSPRTVSSMFNVTVPAATDGTGRIVDIAGFLDRLDGNLPQWDPAGVELTRVDATHWSIQLSGNEGTQIEYKYALGSWDYVEKDVVVRGDRQPPAHVELRNHRHPAGQRHRRRTGGTSRPAVTEASRAGLRVAADRPAFRPAAQRRQVDRWAFDPWTGVAGWNAARTGRGRVGLVGTLGGPGPMGRAGARRTVQVGASARSAEAARKAPYRTLPDPSGLVVASPFEGWLVTTRRIRLSDAATLRP